MTQLSLPPSPLSLPRAPGNTTKPESCRWALQGGCEQTHDVFVTSLVLALVCGGLGARGGNGA